MSENPNSKRNSSFQKSSHNHMTATMIWFLAGCCAEAYLLVIRRFYVNGTLEQVVAWDGRLQYLLYAGLAVLAAGLVLGLAFLKKRGPLMITGWSIFAAGAFLTFSSWIIRSSYPTGTTLMCVLVPILIVVSLLWSLYDRVSFVSMTLLSISILVLWVCRHGVGNELWHTKVLIGAIVYLVLLAAAAFLTKKAEAGRGKIGNLRLIPEKMNGAPIYLSCGISAAAIVLSLFSSTIAYYAMWTTAVILFALAIYYTVKQL